MLHFKKIHEKAELSAIPGKTYKRTQDKFRKLYI